MNTCTGLQTFIVCKGIFFIRFFKGHVQQLHQAKLKGNFFHAQLGEWFVTTCSECSLGSRPFRNEERVWQISYIKVVQRALRRVCPIRLHYISLVT